MLEQTKYGVIIQARMSSNRRPGKVLEDIQGKPMLLRQLERLKKGLKIEKLLVATSEDPSDDPIEELCTSYNFLCYRGSLNDVISRFIGAAQYHNIDYIIRVGGDDPLIDWECCNHLYELNQQEPHDLLFASHRKGWPYGCAAELISRKSLEVINRKTNKKEYLEHTTPYYYDHPNEFKILPVEVPYEICPQDYSFTVDYEEDLSFIKKIFSRLIDKGEFFSIQEVIKLLKKEPKIRDLNKHLHSGFNK